MLKKIAAGVSLITLGFIGFETLYRKREKSILYPQVHERTKWELIQDSKDSKVFKCVFYFKNPSKKYEATLVDFDLTNKLLFNGKRDKKLLIETKILPKYEYEREDEYKTSYIITPDNSLKVEIEVTFSGDLTNFDKIHCAVLHLSYSVYDRRGYHENLVKDIVFVPNKNVEKTDLKALEEKDAMIYPLKTHLLSDEDNLSEVIKKYAGDFLKDGDIVVLAESPVAITQGRFKIPSELKPGWWAKRLCYFVPNVGSLSTPYGMQAAIDQIGTPRFVFAMAVGAAMKVFRKPGWLYTIAGIESELIDDLTGTIPPYDKYIVLGPKDPEKFVQELKKEVGVDIAIADANDLKKARVLASTLKDAEQQITKWLLNNPAGNSWEQTPIVIIRPNNVDIVKGKQHDQTCEV